MKVEVTTLRKLPKKFDSHTAWNSLIGGFEARVDPCDILAVLDQFGVDSNYLRPAAVDLHFHLSRIFGTMYPYFLSVLIRDLRDLKILLSEFSVSDIVYNVLYFSDFPVYYDNPSKCDCVNMLHYLSFRRTIRLY